VVVAAIALVEDGGADALSMRKLGAALGVEAMSLYKHFATKQDLEAAMCDYLLEGVAAAVTKDPIADAVALLTTIRRRLVGHPNTTRLFTVRMDLRNSAAIQRLSFDGLAVLARLEPDADIVLARFRSVLAFTLGFVLIEIANIEAGVEPGSAGDPDAEFDRGVRELIAGGR
jgi:TetR/AcrR family transcriptional regulator, tetracycline repressor protein